MDPVLLGLVVLIATIFVIAAIVFPLWIALHHVLSPKLDGLLLREPYFRKFEQINSMVWPFNYWKTLTYICLIAAPRISKKRRFKGLDEALPVSKAAVIASKIQFWLMCSCVVMFFVYFGYGAFAAYVLPRLQ